MGVTRAEELGEKYRTSYSSYYNEIKDDCFGATVLSKINVKDISKEIAIADHMVEEYYKFLCNKYLMNKYRDEYYYVYVFYLVEILFPQKLLESYTNYKNTKPLYYSKKPEGYISYRWFNRKITITKPINFGIVLNFLNPIETMIEWINAHKSVFQYGYHLVEDSYDGLYHSIKWPITLPDFQNLDLSELNKSCEENRKSMLEGRAFSSVLDNEARWENLDKDLIKFFENQEFISLDDSSETSSFICEDDNRVIQNSKSFKNIIKKANEDQVKMFKSDYQIKDIVSRSLYPTVKITNFLNLKTGLTVDIPITDKLLELDLYDRQAWVNLRVLDLIEIANRNIVTFDNINQHRFSSAEVIEKEKIIRLNFSALDYRYGFERLYNGRSISALKYLSYKELDDLCNLENFIDTFVKWWNETKKDNSLPDYLDIYSIVETCFWTFILSFVITKDCKSNTIIDVCDVSDGYDLYGRYISIMVNKSKSLIYTKELIIQNNDYRMENFLKYIKDKGLDKKFHISPSSKDFKFVFKGIGAYKFINDYYPQEKCKSFMIETLTDMLNDKDKCKLIDDNIGHAGITIEAFGNMIHERMCRKSVTSHIPMSVLEILAENPNILNIIYRDLTIEFRKYTGSSSNFDIVDADVYINANLRKEGTAFVIDVLHNHISLIAEIVLSTIESKKQFIEANLTRDDLVLSKPHLCPDGALHFSFDIKGHLLPEDYPESKKVEYSRSINSVKICGLDKDTRIKLSRKLFLS